MFWRLGQSALVHPFSTHVILSNSLDCWRVEENENIKDIQIKVNLIFGWSAVMFEHNSTDKLLIIIFNTTQQTNMKK